MTNETLQNKTLDLCNAGCTKCPLSELRPTQVVNGIGPLDARIMIVGEAPGPEEDVKGQPFIGRAGKKLDSLLTRAGIHRSQLRITNATRCFPRLRTVEGFRAPSYEEIEACRSYLEEEIRVVRPNVIVPVGNAALSALLGTKKAKISEHRGKEIWSEKFNCKIIPTYHPSAVMRNPNLEETVTQDFRRIIESSRYPEMSKPIEGNYVTINTIEQFDAFCERISQIEESAIDLETSGFNWRKDKIMGVSFSWQKGTGVFLPITKWIGIEHERIELKDKKIRRKGITEIKKIEVIVKELEDTYHPWWADKQDYVMTKLRSIMESDIKWIAQNGKFDWKFFLQMGWNIKPLAYDTLLMHYLLNETGKGSHNLEDMSLQYLGRGQHKQELEDWFKANGMADSDSRNYARVPSELLFKYGATDADDTLQLKQMFLPMLENEGMLELFYNLVMPLNYTLTNIEFDGYKIDPNYLNRAKQTLEKELINKENEIKAIVGEIDIDSPKQLSKLLFEDLKLPPVKKTKTGYSTDEEVLMILKDLHPVPEKIVEFRGIAKLLRTYVIGIEERLDDDNRLHTKFLQEGTESGRLSSRDPNFQNFPRDSKLIKNMFTVEKGNILIEADEGQNEFRWWGVYSNDTQLVKDLNDGIDVHKLVASLANKITYKQVTVEQRQKAKSIVFGLMFNMGAEKLAKEHKVTIEYAEEVKAIFFSRYPSAKQWKYEMVKFAKRNLYVKNRFGRVRHLLAINHPDNKIAYADEQAAVNSPIQGAASDYVSNSANRIFLKFKELGLKGKLRNLIHDAIYVEVPKAELKKSLLIMKEEMERRILGIQVPLVAEFKIGKRWGRMHKIKVENNVEKHVAI